MPLPQWIGSDGVGVDEGAGGDEARAVGLGQELGGGRWWKHIRKEEEANRDAERGAESAANDEDRDPAEEAAHVPINPRWADGAW